TRLTTIGDIDPVVMSNGVSTSNDKNIVDLSRSNRNRAVSKTVRATRERLQTTGSSTKFFDRDALALHVNAMLQSALVTPIFVAVVTAIGLYIHPAGDLLAWALLALSVHAINVLAARR